MNRPSWAKAGFFLLLFCLFSAAVNAGFFRNFDHAAGHWFKETVPVLGAWIFGVVCRTGNAEFTIPAGIILAVWGVRKHKMGFRTALFWTVWFVFGMILEHIMKIRLLQPHPGADVANDPLDRYLKPVLYIETPGSYFSGHTFRVFWLALLAGIVCRKCLRPALLWACVIWVGVIVLGWHWSTDTLGALLLVGVGSAFLPEGRFPTSPGSS